MKKVKPRPAMLAAWADAALALSALRSDRERAHVLSSFFPLFEPAAQRYLYVRLLAAMRESQPPKPGKKAKRKAVRR